jgi:hypothetical protein
MHVLKIQWSQIGETVFTLKSYVYMALKHNTEDQ